MSTLQGSESYYATKHAWLLPCSNVSCLKLNEATFRIALIYTTLSRDSVEYRVAIVLPELRVSAPSTQIRGCSPLWIIHFQCACHQTRSSYCQQTITQTTLSTLPPAWQSVSWNCLISPPPVMCSLLHYGGPLSRNLHWYADAGITEKNCGLFEGLRALLFWWRASLETR